MDKNDINRKMWEDVTAYCYIHSDKKMELNNINGVKGYKCPCCNNFLSVTDAELITSQLIDEVFSGSQVFLVGKMWRAGKVNYRVTKHNLLSGRMKIEIEPADKKRNDGGK